MSVCTCCQLFEALTQPWKLPDYTPKWWFHKRGGGLSVSCMCMHVSMATVLTGASTCSGWYQSGSVCFFFFFFSWGFREVCYSFVCGVKSSQAGVPVAGSTLNMSSIKLSHAKGKKDWGGKRERGGGKAQETNPSSVRCIDANPHWKSVMSVGLHCISALLFPPPSISSRLTAAFSSASSLDFASEQPLCCSASQCGFHRTHWYLTPG